MLHSKLDGQHGKHGVNTADRAAMSPAIPDWRSDLMKTTLLHNRESNTIADSCQTAAAQHPHWYMHTVLMTSIAPWQAHYKQPVSKRSVAVSTSHTQPQSPMQSQCQHSGSLHT
jgi:hypothetical protein